MSAPIVSCGRWFEGADRRAGERMGSGSRQIAASPVATWRRMAIREDS